jgi:hypothetical protein
MDVPGGAIDVPGGAMDVPRPPDAGGPTPDVPSTTMDVVVPSGPAPVIAGCAVFPASHPLNQRVDALPLHPMSAALLANMNPTRGLHPDWGDWSTQHFGIPWSTGTGAPPLPITWSTTYGPRESDPRPCPTGGGRFCYPIPGTVRIEGGPAASAGSDRHVLYIDTAGAPTNCTLFELYNTQNFTGSGWRAASGAIFPLGSTALRPDQWTSADAAGLPILPALVRFDEVAAGEIRHAVRFTMNSTARAFIHPATHAAGTAGTNLPPMGLRLRLRAGFDLAPFSGPALVILRAMQRYGIILADNGSDWFITGDSDDRWAPLMDGLNTAFGQIGRAHV